MQMNAGYILGGQQPDLVNVLATSDKAAQDKIGYERQNAIAALYQQQGPGIAAGDPEALNALARFDPQAALGVQDARLGMQATQQRMAMLSRDEERQVAAEAAKLTAAERAAQAAQIEQSVSMGLAANSPEQWDAMMQTVAPDLVGQFNQREMLAARFMSVAEVLKRQDEMAAGPEQTATMREYEAARGQGFSGTFLEYQTAIAEAKRPQTSVSVGAGESAFAKETGAALAKEAAEVVAAGAMAQRNLGTIATLETALASAPSGAQGALTAVAANIGLKLPGASDVEVASALINQLVPQQRAPGSGPMSDRDLALFKQSLPQIINSPGGNQKIIGTMRAIAEYEVERGKIARRLQLGQITPTDADKEYSALGNPLAEWAGGQSQGEMSDDDLLRKYGGE